MFTLQLSSVASLGKGSISASLLQMPDGTGWGVVAATPFKSGEIWWEASIKAQAVGGVLRGKYHIEAIKEFGTSGWGVVIFQNGTFKGYTAKPADIGRDSRLGVGIDTEPYKVGDFYLTVRVGIFGVNANEWGPPNAYDVLVQNAFNEADLEKIPELLTLTPAKQGLSIPGGNRTNVLFQTAWHHPSGFYMPLQIMPALDFTDDGVHQLIISPHISWEIGESWKVGETWNIETRIDLAFQAHARDIEHEVTTYFGGKLSF